MARAATSNEAIGKRKEEAIPRDPANTSFFASRFFYVLLLGVVLCLSAFLSHHFNPALGLAGWGAGVGLGAAVSLVNYQFLKKVKTARGHAMVTALMASVVASFFVLIAGLFVIHLFWREALVPASLTALALYLTHRFTEALQAWPRVGVAGRADDKNDTISKNDTDVKK